MDTHPSPAVENPIDEVEVSVASDLDAIGGAAWNELWARAEAPSVFARFEWADAWWRSFNTDRTLRVYAARTGGQCVGLLPTSWPLGDTHGQTNPVVLIGNEHSDYAAILTAKGLTDVFLTQRLRAPAPGLTPCAVLDQLATIQMVDVHLPTTDGHYLVLPRYTQPDREQQLLLHQLQLKPAQPPPRIRSKALRVA